MPSYTVQVTDNGYVVWTGTVTPIAGGTVTVPVALVPIITTVTFTVHNSATGAALAGATVTLAGATGTTDGTGTVVFTVTSGGAVTYSVSGSGFTTQTGTVTAITGSNVTQAISLVPVPVTGTVVVDVTDQRTGLPIAGATVKVGSATQQTDAQGQDVFTVAS